MSSDSLSFFDLASQRMNWLAARQHVISENIANADTPDYRARDLRPFEELLEGGSLGGSVSGAVATTQAGHLSSSFGSGPEGFASEVDEVAWEQSIDGNSVVLEQQVIRATDTEDSYRLAADLYRKAHELISLAATGGR
ncbi:MULTISPECIES: flagellar basal body rod protein FlgB [unclassified Roseivivax]|uniref:flagellar basal body rod protein FlgB n=1 Tax=Roseivivax sp. GX 12232 TaxID=2900547 RepID=UPI001E35016A|nr:flagellar basal body protein [Roseivivax sp. GX 12232]MCE0503863.1 flagellar basal body protein [Roseivivax sp. GX 12232]